VHSGVMICGHRTRGRKQKKREKRLWALTSLMGKNPNKGERGGPKRVKQSTLQKY